jgi:hypothetical protein
MNLADGSHRSGMCKAGFAGDDAPRAVFRKCPFRCFQCIQNDLDFNRDN